jgi:trans-aconitate methyltransferase
MSAQDATESTRDIWSAEDYGHKVAPFVASLTNKIVAWLDPQPTDDILDIGCGEGPLTAFIAQHVRRIVGIDASPNMISSFQRNYPEITSRVVDCRFLSREPDLTNGTFDKIFSNAALHWILRDPSTRADTMRACFNALKPGGVMVSESGAFGNVAEVHATLMGELIHRGVAPERARAVSPWWFPTEEAMRALVEGAGLVWIKGEIELRQTKLTDGEGGGIRGW